MQTPEMPSSRKPSAIGGVIRRLLYRHAFDGPMVVQHRGDRLRRAVHALRPDLTLISIDNAYVRCFHRQVDSGTCFMAAPFLQVR